MASQSGYGDSGSSKLEPRDLPSKRLLGTGVASVGYETELNGKKCARKDFMGVPSGTFRREAARLVGLEDHINVVKTLGWTENKMSCSLVLEHMDDDLLGILQKRKQSQGSMAAGLSSGDQSDLDSRNTIKLAPFEFSEALDFMLQIARGMEFLSDKGIRHGNLKTKNVLVTRTNDRDRNSLSVKVSDFGLVRTRRKSTSFASRQARKLDMARWTPPEMLQVFLLEDKGETSSESDSDEDGTDSLDVADSDVPEWRKLGADVYSFAVTCSQILTGEDPYPNLNWKELGINIVRRGLTPTLPAACPQILRELLVSCWGCDRYCQYLRNRPSFSHIRKTLERLQMRIPAPHFLPLPEKGPMYIKREGQLWEPMPGKEPADVVREIGLREPINVEDLWDPEWLQHPAWPDCRPAGSGWFFMYQNLITDVAGLIASTRTVVRRRTEWNQLREELELMLPDLLRIRNRWFSCEKTLGVQRFNDLGGSMIDWSMLLRCEVNYLFDEVGMYQQHEDDRLQLSLSSAALTKPRRVPKFSNVINRLAKERTEIMMDLTKMLRQAQVQAKEQAKEKTDISLKWRYSYATSPIIF